MYKVRHYRRTPNWFNNSVKGAVTVVSNLIYEPDQQVPSAIEFAVSYCSPKDQFVKKHGIQFAEKRLQDKLPAYYRRLPLSANRRLRCYELDRLIIATIGYSMNRPEWVSSILQ